MRSFIFPGQGSQYKGMGVLLLEKFPKCEEYIRIGEEILNIDLRYLLFEADDDVLKDTENAQISILLTSYIYFKFLEKKGIIPYYVCGHSLGEYSALLVSEVLEFKDALLLVRERAKVMKKFIGEIRGVQLAVMNLNLNELEKLIELFQENGVIQIAGYNSKTQIVVSLEESLIEEFKKEVEKLRGKILPLKTSLPFHSPLMKKAEDEFRQILDKVTFNSPKYLYISSVVNEVIQNGEEIKNVLMNQITKPVRWIQTVEKLISFGVNEFYEVGPNKILTNLISKDYSNLRVLNSESIIKEDKYERV
ncbi:MAG: ACP S-malonyltransferase [Caldisericia bacterium]|nr:ACP S-malonyltransferase [Caldisericia bacterium]